MAIKFEKNISMTDFLERILPFTPWAVGDIQKWAIDMANNGEDYFCIVRDIRFNISKESVLEYAKDHGVDNSFNDEADDAFKAAVEGVEPAKRKPGRPRKARPGDPFPSEEEIQTENFK